MQCAGIGPIGTMKLYRNLAPRCLAVLAAATLSLAVMAQGPSDWKPSKMSAIDLGKRVEKMFKTFKNVAGGVELNFKAPDATDPKGYGIGRMLMNEYFWSPTRFRIEFLTYGKMQSGEWHNPTNEYIATDGKKTMRLGSMVPAGKSAYTASQGLFDVKSDAELVEKWPTEFPRFIMSPFMKGNATVTRYLTALSSGVGGYKVKVEERQLLISSKHYKQYRVFAERRAKGKQPASTVEMIFDDAVWLPVTIHTTYGKHYDLNWFTTWLNNQRIPGDPFKIGVKN